MNYYSKNFLLVNIKIGIIFYAFSLFLNRAWVGEDAFIYFRYVDNFVNGNGLVFNIGERVEGFTSPLWVFALSFLRATFKWELRHIAIALGLFLSTISVSLLLFKDHKKSVLFPVGVLILITNSAFRDFATSGFETSLVLLLLIIVALTIKYSRFEKYPIMSGLLASLLSLARPEATLVLVYFFLVFFLSALLKGKWKSFLLFLIFPLLIVGGYQLFRMGYYASFFPNTYYAKRGGELYLSQGINYLKDFYHSYTFSVTVLLLSAGVAFINKIFNLFPDSLFRARISLIFLSGLLGLYVTMSGGDFMHGRSLLMAFTLFAIAVSDVFELLLNKLVKVNSTFKWAVSLILSIILIFFSLPQVALSAKVHKQVNKIHDERLHFGFDKIPKGGFREYLAKTITGQFHWMNRGYYYRDVANAIDMRILVNMPNIGFFGYAATDMVSVMGTSLIDPPQAKLPLSKRGTIGHEDEGRWDYLLTRKPTFSYTPFKQWNASAQFRYGKSISSAWIKDDSDDSFIPILDISDKVFLDKFSAIVGSDVKRSIDSGQRAYLQSLRISDVEEDKQKLSEYFGFLKYYWVPYASEMDKRLYLAKANELFGEGGPPNSFDTYYDANGKADAALWERITKPLSVETFIENVLFSVDPYYNQIIERRST